MQKITPNQNSLSFSAVFLRHFAKAILPFGLKVCHAFCKLHELSPRQPPRPFKPLHFIPVAFQAAGCP
jgi:hypothetical protein